MESYRIVIDTREQLPLTFRESENMTGVITKTLKVGDYSIEGQECNISIERKSIADLYGTLGKDNQRFQRELAKATSLDFFGIVVEGSFTDVRDGNFPNSFRSKMRPNVVVSILFTLMLKYNIHVFFCKDRNEASSLIRNIFNSYMKRKERTADFEYSADLEMVERVQKLKKRLRIDR